MARGGARVSPQTNPRAHTSPIVYRALSTVFSFWLAALSLSSWLAAGGFGSETAASCLREEGASGGFPAEEVKNNLWGMPLKPLIVQLVYLILRWPARSETLTFRLCWNLGILWAAGWGGDVSSEGSPRSLRALEREGFHVAVGLRCLRSVRMRVS